MATNTPWENSQHLGANNLAEKLKVACQFITPRLNNFIEDILPESKLSLVANIF
jgi:hypothetical protein